MGSSSSSPAGAATTGGAAGGPSAPVSSIPEELLQAANRQRSAATMSASEAAAAKAGFDPSKHDKLKANQYKIASPEAERYFYESQPANRKDGAATDFKSNLAMGNEGHKATAAAAVIAEEVAKQGGKLTVIDNSMSQDEIRRIISETEGLHISKKRREELSKQWRFFLASDPVQYGLDAGFVTGSLLAAWSIRKRENRTPYRVTCYLAAGYAAGFAIFPFVMIAWEEYNMRKITRNEREMMQRQRTEFLAKQPTPPPEAKV